MKTRHFFPLNTSEDNKSVIVTYIDDRVCRKAEGWNIKKQH